MGYQESKELKEFNQLFKEMMDLYYETAVRSGLSESAYDIFYAITCWGEGCSQKDIADLYHMSRTTINSSLKKLEEQGFIFLEKGTGKNKLLYLTEKGKAYMEQKILPCIQLEEAVFREMKPEENREFLSLLRRYVQIYRRKVIDRL